MKTVTKVVLVLLVSSVALMASQEPVRAYVSDGFCCLLSCVFGD
jgi:hypothetical protein